MCENLRSGGQVSEEKTFTVTLASEFPMLNILLSACLTNENKAQKNIIKNLFFN